MNLHILCGFHVDFYRLQDRLRAASATQAGAPVFFKMQRLYALLDDVRNNRADPALVSFRFKEFQTQLRGRDRLLLTVAAHDADLLSLLLEQVTACLPSKACRIEAGLIVGPQDMLLEQRCRWSKDFSRWEKTAREFYATDCCRLDRLADTVVTAVGFTSLHVLAANESQPYAGIDDPVLWETLSRIIGIDATQPASPQSPRAYSYSLQSYELLHLLKQFTAPFQAGLTTFLPFLREAEQKLGLRHNFLSSPHARAHALEVSAAHNARLAQKFLRREELFPARSFLADLFWEPYTGLDSRSMVDLLRFFPQHMARLLLSEIDNHADLSAKQRLLAAALQDVCRAHVFSVGPVWPPSPAKVTVLTLTRNQKEMISVTMDSVLAQRTNFPVEHMVVDDCSVDGTQDVIAAYAEKYEQIKPVFLRQKSRRGQNVTALFSRCRSPYVALCDGDDYFSDPLKLQTQVDFMEAHPECGLCFHPVKVIYEDGSGRERLYPPLEEMPRGVREFYYLSDLLRVNFIQTNSVMYRWRFTQGLPEWFVPDLVPGDWYWHLLHAERGKIGFINKVMSVYRRHTASLFYASEISPKANRLKHGLSELRTYDVINRHFKGRYAKVLQSLANNVFANLLEHSMQTGEDTLLTVAKERFPELAREFFAEVKIVRVPGTRT